MSDLGDMMAYAIGAELLTIAVVVAAIAGTIGAIVGYLIA